MKWLVSTIVALSVFLAPEANGKPEEPVDFAKQLAGKRILHVGAHQDDEGIFAPMMAEACRFNSSTCHMVVALDEDNWGCLLTIGMEDRTECGRIRRLEGAASAANLNATLEFYGWPGGLYNWNDAGVRSNLQGLEREVGSHAALVARFRKTLDSVQPEVVLAFDPRHGTTCHPNHRAVVTLLLEAIDGLPLDRQPQVWLGSDYAVPGAPSEVAAITDKFGIVRWPDDPTPVHWYDATVALRDGRTAFDYLVDVLRLNGSQFPDVATGKMTPAPASEHRRVPLVRLLDIDPAQAGMCENRAPPFLLNLEAMSEAEVIKAIKGN